MKYYLFFLISFFLISCGGGNSLTSSSFDDDTRNHKRIAVLPFKTKFKLKQKELNEISKEDLKTMEINQGKEVQNAIESFLLGQKLRVRVQSQSVTNSRLINNGIDLSKINDEDITRLAKILGVDAVVSGEIEIEKPMSDNVARGLNMAKNLAWSVSSKLGSLGRSISTTTNKGRCSVSAFEGKHGDRLWSYRDDIEMGQGSTTQDVIDEMMKKGVDKFPYKK